LLAQWQDAGLIGSGLPSSDDQLPNSEISVGLEELRLPHGFPTRLHNLLNRQGAGNDLTSQERLEAEGLVDLAEFLSLLSMSMSSTFLPR